MSWQDARLDTAAIDQDFALVVSGDLARARHGAGPARSRQLYRAGRHQVEVFDPSRAASNSVSVLVKSTTEPAGETYLLNSTGAYGVFTGAVAMVVGAAASDGKLEIHNGDSIEADYVDSSGSLRAATAVADLVPPVISAVAATVDLGVITITWQTSEPANSIVHYGTNLVFQPGGNQFHSGHHPFGAAGPTDSRENLLLLRGFGGRGGEYGHRTTTPERFSVSWRSRRPRSCWWMITIRRARRTRVRLSFPTAFIPMR